MFVYPDTDPEEGGHRSRICRGFQQWWRNRCSKKKKVNRVAQIAPTGSAPVDELAGLTAADQNSGLDAAPPPPLLDNPAGKQAWRTPAALRPAKWRSTGPAPPPPPEHTVVPAPATPRDPPPRSNVEEKPVKEGRVRESYTADAVVFSDGRRKPKLLKAHAVQSVAEQLKQHTQPRCVVNESCFVPH